jgi:catechol 2,3-dioxygenase-like lactoylglutathione lyase family enzyme
MTIEYRRINHVTLAVPAGQHAKVREFYGGVLGLREVKRPEALGVVYDIIWYELLDMLLQSTSRHPGLSRRKIVTSRLR